MTRKAHLSVLDNEVRHGRLIFPRELLHGPQFWANPMRATCFPINHRSTVILPQCPSEKYARGTGRCSRRKLAMNCSSLAIVGRVYCWTMHGAFLSFRWSFRSSAQILEQTREDGILQISDWHWRRLTSLPLGSVRSLKISILTRGAADASVSDGADDCTGSILTWLIDTGETYSTVL